MMLDREDMEISYMNSVSSLSEDETPIILSMKKPSKYDKGLINRKSMIIYYLIILTLIEINWTSSYFLTI